MIKKFVIILGALKVVLGISFFSDCLGSLGLDHRSGRLWAKDTTPSKAKILPSKFSQKKLDKGLLPWTYENNLLELRDVTYEQYRQHYKSELVPSFAENIWSYTEYSVDHHLEVFRFKVPKQNFMKFCGDLCQKKYLSKRFPPEWPNQNQLLVPNWFESELFGPGHQTWLRSKREPSPNRIDEFSEQAGCQPIGRISGQLFSVHKKSQTVYLLDFSRQYGAGCGG